MAGVAQGLQTIGAAPAALGAPMPSIPGLDNPGKRLADLSVKREAADKQFAADSSGLQERMGAERAVSAALPEPKLENVNAEFKHQPLAPEKMTDMMQTMFAFAAIGGAMTRNPMTAAMNGMSAALKGFQEGDKIMYQRGRDEFDRNLKVAMQKNAQATEGYKLAREKHRGNMQDLMNEWNILAKKHGDTVTSANMERGDIQAHLRHVENLSKMDMQAKKMDQDAQLGWARVDAMIRGQNIQASLGQQRIDAMLLKMTQPTAAAVKAEGVKDEKKEGQRRYSEKLGLLADYYNELQEVGGAIEKGGGTINNMLNYIGSTAAGQAGGRMLATDAQTVRDKINQVKPLLMADLKQASGMSAQQLNSNAELQFYMQAATDPSREISVNLGALELLDKAYGLGMGIKAPAGAVEALKKQAPKGGAPLGAPAATAQPAAPITTRGGITLTPRP